MYVFLSRIELGTHPPEIEAGTCVARKKKMSDFIWEHLRDRHYQSVYKELPDSVIDDLLDHIDKGYSFEYNKDGVQINKNSSFMSVCILNQSVFMNMIIKEAFDDTVITL